MHILPSAYLAPISYYYYLVNFPTIVEIWAHYQKQTLSNRCQIATAHGVENLIIPVEHTSHTPLCEVRISSHHAWQTLHWRTIEAAYSASPFFEYYRDDLMPLYQQPFERLIDWNEALQRKILQLLDYDVTYSFSEDYKKNFANNEIDLRNAFNTKKNVVTLPLQNEAPRYYQVFEQKVGFLPNLSIIDLLFNMGNEARIILRKR